MSPLLLTDKERDRFSEWLKREAYMDEGQANLMKTLGPGFGVIADHKMKLAAAKKLIARELDSIESFTVRPDEQGPLEG